MSVLCKTSNKGTNERGIIEACTNLGVAAAELRLPKTETESAIARLHHSLCSGSPVISCVDNWNHWVVCAGFLGNSILCLDGASDDGILIYKETDFLKRWEHSRYGYFGIAINKKEII